MGTFLIGIMKAKEYATLFIHRAPNLNQLDIVDEAVRDVLKGFHDDLLRLILVRKPVFDEAYISIFEELNAKWNSLARRLESHYGKTVLNQNGISILISDLAPEIKEIWDRTQKRRP